MPIRLAAIGVGHWHSLYDAAYLKAAIGMANVTLVGIQDPDPALAVERAAALGDPPIFADYREMLARLRPDFVIVLGRHDAMAVAAHHLLNEGYPFLIEKPVGLNAAQVRGVADKAAAKGTFAAVPLFQRYHPFVTHARKLLADGAFGPLSHFHYRANRGSSARYVSWGASWMLDPAVAGGGCLRNIGTHGIDLLLHILGEDAEVTGAQTSTRALGREVEDYAAVLLRSASGVLATIEVGNTYPAQGADGEWKLSGRDGLLLMQNGAVRWITAGGEQHLAGPPATPLPTMALGDALMRWQSGEPPAAGIEDCLRAMRIIDRAYEIAPPGQPAAGT
jgi:predicted dehydrogenase